MWTLNQYISQADIYSETWQFSINGKCRNLHNELSGDLTLDVDADGVYFTWDYVTGWYEKWLLIEEKLMIQRRVVKMKWNKDPVDDLTNLNRFFFFNGSML